jgi:FtsH-binding integral membrane protein
MADPGVRIEHPNRRKAASKVTRAVVVLLLLVSAVLVAVVTVGGWDLLQGAKALSVAYIVVYVVLAFFVLRWSRGVLPLAAALAIVLLIFAAVSAPAWFDRDQPGFAEPTLDAGILGLVTALIVPVQLLLIAFAMSGFRQAWNVEIEHPVDEPPPEPRGRGGPAAAAA